MLHHVLQGLREQLSLRLAGWLVDPVKTTIIVSLAKETVVNGLKTHAAVYSMQNLQELLRNDESLEKSQIAKRMVTDYKSDLVNVGDLRARQADDVSKFVIPFLLLMISHKLNTNPSSLESLLFEKEDKGFLCRFKFWGSTSTG